MLSFVITYEQSGFYLPFAVIELYVSSSVFFFFFSDVALTLSSKFMGL